MIVGIVTMSAIKKYKRMDAGFFIDDHGCVDAVRRAELQMKRAKATLRRRKKELAVNQDWVKKHKIAGDVKDLEINTELRRPAVGTNKKAPTRAKKT